VTHLYGALGEVTDGTTSRVRAAITARNPTNVNKTSEVLFRLCANTDPQRDSIFTKGPANVLDHATSEIANGSKLGIDATKKLPGDGFKQPWPPLIKMDEALKAKVENCLAEQCESVLPPVNVARKSSQTRTATRALNESQRDCVPQPKLEGNELP